MNVYTDYKFVIALNKSIDVGVALNAASHLALSIVAQASEEQKTHMSFITYQDGNNHAHPMISALSLIVLRGSASDIKKLKEAAQDNGLLMSDFIETMTGGTYLDQLELTKKTIDVVYYGVALFGKRETIDPLTKRLSLYK